MQTFFILDEFANIGKIPDFDKKISTSRSRKISFSVILQNLDQLEAVYKESHETILGNCDTHVFLGSNSQKTVEYFSKALGEKTIFRESESINKDRNDWKQGKSVSEQNMARALLTPDELRRLDVDQCIIYEKGLKPIRAQKYYYFNHPTEKQIRPFRVDHNDREVTDRGKWRTYNPYNPYEEKRENAEPTKIESLDDLFADNEPKKEEKPKEEKNNNNVQPILDLSSLDMPPELPMEPVEEPKVEPQTPQEKLDLQKEMEAKFDELFGTLNDID